MKKIILRILLIEDNRADAELIGEMIERCGATCVLRTADRLASGLLLIEQENFDVVILDLGLPDSSGIDTLRSVQLQKPEVPVIVLTGMADDELAAGAIAMGAQDYLMKGTIESEMLYRSILYSIERKRNETSMRERKELSEELNKLDHLIHSTLDFDSVLQRLIQSATRAVGAESAAIGRFIDGTYVIRHVYKIPEEMIGRPVASAEVKGVLDAAETRDVVVFSDAGNDSRLDWERLRASGIRSMMIAPFILKDTVLGAMSFFSLSSPSRFTEAHLDFARRLSASISIAMENARLYDALRDSEQLSRTRLSQLQAIYSSAPVGLCFTDADLRYVNINERLAEMHGLPADQHVGKTIAEVVPRLAGSIEPYFRLAIEKGVAVENVEMEPPGEDGGGSGQYWLTSYYPVKDQAGRTVGVNAVVQDITMRRKMEEEIRHLANHDVVTGLPNRRLFIELIALELAQARRHGSKVAVFFLDLDRFKNVNDELGHEAGDELLRQVAVGLRATVRSSDTVARIGGDEFNIIISDISQAGAIVDIARKIVSFFDRTFTIAGRDLRITASIGISVFPDDGEDTDLLLRYADIAMYHAKEQGRNNYQFYNPEINSRSRERARVESCLGRALERGEMVIYYQPLVDIATNRTMCAEALVRWRHPEMGIIDPAEFIAVAEETGFIADIDEWVLRSVCRQAGEWADSGLPPVCFTVNLSARQFENPELIATISRILGETGMEPGRLHLEITERMAMSNAERTADRLRELVKLGIHVSIDNFGTGCSSLNHLQRLPIERLKIDRSFVRQISTDSDDRTVISAVMAMAHTMKLRVLAQGVETEEQLSFLKNAGCDEVQGFLFSRPLPAEEFRDMISARA